MGSPTLTQIEKILALPDPLLTYKWMCDTLPFTDQFGIKPEYMEAIDLPFNNIAAAQPYHSLGGYLLYPGTHTLSAFTATFYEDRFGTATSWILYWKSLIKNFKTGSYGMPEATDRGPGYKQSIKVNLLDAKNDVVVGATLTGCWPSDTNPFSLTYTDFNGRLVIQQSFSVDDVEYLLPKARNLAGGLAGNLVGNLAGNLASNLIDAAYKTSVI